MTSGSDGIRFRCDYTRKLSWTFSSAACFSFLLFIFLLSLMCLSWSRVDICWQDNVIDKIEGTGFWLLHYVCGLYYFFIWFLIGNSRALFGFLFYNSGSEYFLKFYKNVFHSHSSFPPCRKTNRSWTYRKYLFIFRKTSKNQNP